MQQTLLVIYASTSGHTEHVADTLIAALEGKTQGLRIVKQRAEQAKAEDLLSNDVLVLASSTWNTGNVEGQLNPHMHELLMKIAMAVDLKGHPCAAIGLGDERYYFTAKAAEQLTEYVKTHNGTLLLPTLKIVNEPYGQEAKVIAWAEQLRSAIEKLPGQAHS